MKPECPGPGWKANPGEQPKGTKGKRVMVVLANGIASKKQLSATAPPHWSADTTRWALTGDPFDVAWWKRA